MKGRKKAVITYMLVVLLFLGIALVYTRPLVARADKHVLGDPGDTLMNIYIITWTSRTLFSNPLNLFNATMFYPNSHTLAYSDHQLMQSLFALPVLGLTGNPILSFNFVVIFCILLSAVGAFLLVDHLTGDKLAALAGGIIYGFPIYKLAHITHMNLLSTGFIPLAILCLHLYTEKRKPVYALLFGVFTVALFWTAWSYGFFLAFAVLVYLLILALYKRGRIVDIVRKRVGAPERRAAYKWVALLLAAFLLTVVVLVPFVRPYLKLNKTDPNFKRDIRTVDQFSADVQDFLAAPKISLLWGRALDGFRKNTLTRGGPAERSLFTGLMPLLLAIAGVVYLVRRRRYGNNSFLLAFYATIFVLSIIFCLGVTFNVNGHHYNVFMPYRLLYHFFPGFQAIRTPTRMMVMALMSLSVFGGFCVRWIRDGLGGRIGNKKTVAVVIVLLALLTGEMMSTYVKNTELPLKSEFPAAYHWLESRPGSAPTAVLPVADYNPVTFKIGLTEEPSWLIREPWRVYYSTANWKKLLNGFSGYIPRSYYDAVKALRDFPSDGAVGFLRRLGVKYVLVEGARYGRGTIERVLDYAKRRPKFRLVKNYGNDYVFQLT